MLDKTRNSRRRSRQGRRGRKRRRGWGREEGGRGEGEEEREEREEEEREGRRRGRRRGRRGGEEGGGGGGSPKKGGSDMWKWQTKWDEEGQEGKWFSVSLKDLPDLKRFVWGLSPCAKSKDRHREHGDCRNHKSGTGLLQSSGETSWTLIVAKRGCKQLIHVSLSFQRLQTAHSCEPEFSGKI